MKLKLGAAPAHVLTLQGQLLRCCQDACQLHGNQSQSVCSPQRQSATVTSTSPQGSFPATGPICTVLRMRHWPYARKSLLKPMPCTPSTKDTSGRGAQRS